MRFFLAAAMALTILCTNAEAKSRKIVEPLPAEVVDNMQIVSVEVIAEGSTAQALAHFDQKASEKAAAGAKDSEEANSDAKPKYSQMPFKEMFPRVVTDVTQEWGLTQGRPVKLTVTLDTIKTANAGAAMFLGSSDQLAGMVVVADNETGAQLGSFYIDVLNSHSGMFGMMLRGSGIREKLAEEFALESCRILTGRKSKRKRS